MQVDSITETYYVMATVLTLCTITATACLLQQYAGASIALVVVMNISGGIGGNLVGFIIPGAIACSIFYSRISKGEGHLFYLGCILVAFGLGVSAVIIYSIIVEYGRR
jgi:hypothetical protein